MGWNLRKQSDSSAIFSAYDYLELTWMQIRITLLNDLSYSSSMIQCIYIRIQECKIACKTVQKSVQNFKLLVYPVKISDHTGLSCISCKQYWRILWQFSHYFMFLSTPEIGLNKIILMAPFSRILGVVIKHCINSFEYLKIFQSFDLHTLKKKFAV